MIHWTWAIFVVIVLILLRGMFSGDDSLDIRPMIYSFLLIIFIVLWGGIFWW